MGDGAAAPALVIMTELKMIIRHLRLIEYAHELGVVPVMVHTKSGDTARLRELMATPEHPLSHLGELRHVPAATVDGAVAGVRDLAGRYAVRGVVSCGEYFVEPAAVVAHLLDLPGSGWPAGATSRNKLLQRSLLPEYAPRWHPVPPGTRALLPDLEAEWGGGPLVVKPTSRMSSSGVREVRSAGELGEVLDGYPAAETLLVEQRVSGPEFSVESLVQDGVPVWCGVTAKETTEGSGSFVETAHTVPAPGLSPERLRALEQANTAVLQRMGFRNGVAHAEFRLPAGGPVLMEVALRVPGDGLSVLWGLATGASMEERIVDLALGRPASYPRPVRRARHSYLQHPSGRLADVRSEHSEVSWTVRDLRWPVLRPSPPDAPARCRAVLVSKVPGDELGGFTDSDGRAVSVMVDAPLTEDIDKEARCAQDGIDVAVG